MPRTNFAGRLDKLEQEQRLAILPQITGAERKAAALALRAWRQEQIGQGIAMMDGEPITPPPGPPFAGPRAQAAFELYEWRMEQAALIRQAQEMENPNE